MIHEEWLERGEIYALGALDEEERREVEAHLASGCSVCAAYIRETRETLTLLHRSLTPAEPPPAIKARLLEHVAKETPISLWERLRMEWRWWSFGAGALAAAGLILTLSWNLALTRQELQALQGRVGALQVELAQQEQLFAFLLNPQARLIQLAGLQPSPAATGRLFWDPVDRKGLLLTASLPQAPAGKDYELWAITGSEPVPAGVFKVDERGRAWLRLPPLPARKTFDKFAVTLEPSGGVRKPTGPMVLVGEL